MPLSAPVILSVAVKTFGGQPSNGRWIRVRLDAPAPTGFLSTDFPLVEGSRLLEIQLPIIDDKAEWRQVFPIRGEYRLSAELVGGVDTKKVFQFYVQENHQKWLILSAFALALFVTGVIAGRVFSAPGQRKRARLNSLVFVLLHCCGAMTASGWATDNHARKYDPIIEVGTPAVGTPARIRWRLQPTAVSGKISAKLAVKITHLEKDTVVFYAEKIPVSNEYSLDYQFTDGTDYQIVTIADIDGGETVRQEQRVSVNAIAPPWRAQVPALAMFLFLISAGLLVGRLSVSGRHV